MNRYHLAALLTLVLFVTPTYATIYEAPPDIVVTLPKFCWAQYIKSVENNPDYGIQGCGAYSNHYCPGLVQIALAERLKNDSEKLEQLRMAADAMTYTLNFTKDYPDCFLRPLAQSNLIDIKSKMDLIRLLHRKVYR